MKKHVVEVALRARRMILFGRAGLGLLCIFLECVLSPPLSANPAIANNPPCNSAIVGFMTTSSNEARALAFVRALPGVSRIEKGKDGVYSAEFGSADAVNALIADLNQNHANEVIDLFQFFQCKYHM
jgi:hypothetical protein